MAFCPACGTPVPESEDTPFCPRAAAPVVALLGVVQPDRLTERQPPRDWAVRAVPGSRGAAAAPRAAAS